MTGMPASFAFWRAGRIALLSCASRIRTLAPFEMRVSTSVSCCSLLRFASASMYLPPAASTVCLMFGWSCAAHRGCWKLFQDTPTVHPAPPPPPLALAAGELVLLPQAATRMAVAPAIAASLRISMRTPPPVDDLVVTTKAASYGRRLQR